MPKYLNFIVLLALVFSLSSCKIFVKPVVEKICDIKVVSISPDKSVVEISLIVRNPNPYKIRLSKLDIEVLNKDRGKVGIAALNKEVEIPKKASINLDFRAELDTRPVVKMVSSLDQKVQFFVHGSGRGKALGVGRNFSFDEPFELDMKEHLENLLARFSASGQDLFKVKHTAVEKVGIGETELHVGFMILNPYGFSFNFKGFPAEIYLNGKLAGKGNLQNQLRFDENIYAKDGVMVFKLSNLKSILSAITGVFKGEIAYTVKGKVLIDAMGIQVVRPYEYDGVLPVSIWQLLLK